jgi:hypothetical protein
VRCPHRRRFLYGSLTGNVTDAADAAVAGAKVEAANTATGVTRQGTADERGTFLFNDLQPGTYKVSISCALVPAPWCRTAYRLTPTRCAVSTRVCRWPA